MGIQINGITDTISATDGGLAVSGQQLTGVTDINASGIGTFSNGIRVTGVGSSIGIGTNNPAEQLELSAGSERLMIGANSPSSYSRIAARNTTNTGYRGFQIDGSDLLINSNTSGNVIIGTGGGNTGIGTNNPTQKLEVFVNRTSSTNATSIILNDNVTGAQTNGVYKAIRSLSNNGVSVSEIRFVESDGTNNNTAIALATQSTANALTERVRVDNSGRLLVGTSTARGDFFNTSNRGPSFQVEGTTTNTSGISVTANLNNDNGAELNFGKSRGTNTGSSTIVSNGDGLGRISFQGADGSELVPAAYIEATVDGTPGSNDMPGRLVFSTTADGASSPTERMRITQDGDVFINHNSSTSPVVGGEKLGVVGVGNIAIAANTTTNTTPTLFLANGSDTNNAYVARFSTGSGGNTRGEIYYNGSQLVYATSSDYRLKENVVSFDAGIEIVKQLRPVKYNWIENGNEDIGFIAHEVQEIFPNAVGGVKDAIDENGKILPQTYDPSKLVPLLTAALQEAIGEIESLKARVVALESA